MPPIEDSHVMNIITHVVSSQEGSPKANRGIVPKQFYRPRTTQPSSWTAVQFIMFALLPQSSKSAYLSSGVHTWLPSDFLFPCVLCWLSGAFIFFFFFFLIEGWLQYCVGVCHASTWITHGYTCPLPPAPASHFLPRPIPLVCPRAPVWVLWVIQQSPMSVLHMLMYMLPCHSLHLSHHLLLTLPLRVNKSLFSVSAPSLLPSK